MKLAFDILTCNGFNALQLSYNRIRVDQRYRSWTFSLSLCTNALTVQCSPSPTVPQILAVLADSTRQHRRTIDQWSYACCVKCSSGPSPRLISSPARNQCHSNVSYIQGHFSSSSSLSFCFSNRLIRANCPSSPHASDERVTEHKWPSSVRQDGMTP